jgi:hypothetical protein
MSFEHISKSRGIVRRLAQLTVFALVALAGPAVVQAGEVDTSFPFELDRWYDLDVTDGPVTLHRIRVVEKTTGITKSSIFRAGGSSPYATTAVIELEYSNESSRDWEAKVLAHWVDDQGREIDGYDGEETLGEDERNEDTTMTISTIKYGLEMARQFEVKISFEED